MSNSRTPSTKKVPVFLRLRDFSLSVAICFIKVVLWTSDGFVTHITKIN